MKLRLRFVGDEDAENIEEVARSRPLGLRIGGAVSTPQM